MTKITKRIRGIEVSKADDLSTMVYILSCQGGLILIDVGFTPHCLENIEAELSDMGETWRNIKLVLITHAHGDHIENLPKVLELTGHPEVMLGAGDIDALKDLTGVEADIGLEHGDLIDACGGIEIVAIPGHSNGNLAYYLRDEKAMIVGDTIFGDDQGNLYPPPAKYSDDAEMAKREITRLLNYDFDKLLLAHGKNILRDAKREVEKLVES
ncbi:MAG: MBL fold metallo-hydrolase [Candidatus Bathyarchaeia archaeon]|jgi:glyoxylase-like metal-dependent hydrolase (beta-lactamase superfamily II)